MSRVSSSYASIVRGVSEQVPQDRLPGQHWEQVNMVSDARRGLARRHGSITMDEKQLGIPAMSADQHRYARNYRVYDFFVDDTEYSFVYQSAERPTSDALPFCYCLNKVTGKFLNVAYAESTPGALDDWKYGGLSALTVVGKFLALASQRIGPGYSTVDKFAAQSDKAVAWVRAGVYSRTFKVTVKRASDGQTFNAAYTTMSSSYPNLLNTADIPATATDYQKQVNDRVNAYNSAANKWIGDASADVQPQNIATKLKDQLVTAGFTSISTQGGSIIMSDVAQLSVDDSGDGTMFRAIHNEVDDPAKLSTVHWTDKVVRVKPKGTDQFYYMTASSATAASGTAGAVSWIEGAAQVVTPGQVFALAAISSDGQTIHVADTPQALSAVLGTPVPTYTPSVVGDTSSKGGVPYFFGRRITLMTVFMDRLVIVCNGVVFMSRTGDYFNWFKQSMLSSAADDPIEAYALGSEDDIISRSVTYNKDLFMFGERNQYALSGRAALTPGTISLSTTASEKDSANAQPLVVGNLLFYGKYEAAPNQQGPSPYAASVSQFQLGLFEDSPETYLVSQQLDKYLRGRPTEFTALPSPHTVFVRTDGYDYGLYVYRFIDQPGTQQRMFDSWSRWEWSTHVGQIVGLTMYKATLFVYTLRENAAGTWIACEQFVMDSDLSVNPYLDAQRSTAEYAAGTGFFHAADDTVLDDAYVAAGQGSDVAFLGAHISNFDSFNETVLEGTKPAMVGVLFAGMLQTTSPFVRDQNDKAMVNGRLVVNRYTLSLTNTSGLDAYRVDSDGTKHVYGFNGRRIGISNNVVGEQPITTTTVDVPCGRATREHRMEYRTRSWLPMTLSAIEWVGQLFNNTRRV